MKRQRIFALLFLAAILAAATASDVFSAEKAPAWGWKEEDGAGTLRKPRPAPAQNAWQAKVAAPDLDALRTAKSSPLLVLRLEPNPQHQSSPTAKT